MSSRSLERVRKRNNEDEEIMFIILPALYLYVSQRKRQKRHLYFLYGKEYVRELLQGHLKNCLTAFRMEPHMKMWLASYLRSEGLVSDSRIKVEEKLAFFLFMLSHNASYEDLQLEFHHSGQISSKYINQFFDIIPTLSARFLKPTNLDEPHPKITTDPRFFPYFQVSKLQNGWSKETWNIMVDLFHERNNHVNFAKSQVQDKEKELKRDYRMLKDARMQSGVGWQETNFKLPAEPHLWDNLEVSFGTRIQRFKRKSFPLYDSLAELYHKHTAEGNYNFTSTAKQFLKPGVTDIESDDDESDAGEKDENLQMLDKSEVEHVQFNQMNADVDHTQVNQRNAEVEHAQVNQKKATCPSTNRNKKPKKSPKKSTGDGLVGVMERFVNIKEKQAEDEKAESKDVNKFAITKCIVVLQSMNELAREEKKKAYKVFKSAENRETFLTSADVDRETSIMWLRQEIEDLPGPS